MSIVVGNPGQVVSQSGSVGYINNVLDAAKVAPSLPGG
jgi:hypothetical protein